MVWCSVAFAGQNVTGNLYVSGNTGIGTAIPRQRLEVEGIVYSQTGGFQFPDLTTQTTAATNTPPGGSNTYVQYNNSSAFGGNAGFVFVNPNVGIGTSSPSAKLDVEGTVYFGGGNVGIGTGSPSNLLDIEGITPTVQDINALATSIGGIDSYSKLVSHFDGANGQTSYTAETGQVFTFGGTAQLETANKKFGTSGLLFGGGADWVSVPDSDDWNFGSGDFTWDLWVRRANVGATGAVLGQSASNGTPQQYLRFQDTNTLYFIFKDTGGTNRILETASTHSDSNSFHHVVVERSGNTIKIAYDGIWDSNSLNVAGITLDNYTSAFSFGRTGDYADMYFVGRIDEPRITKGLARWSQSSSFTPPTAPYDNSGAGSAYSQYQLNGTNKAVVGWNGIGNYTTIGGTAIASPAIAIDVNNNIGIGSTAPATLLDVNGVIYGHTNVGIGTSVPAAALDMASGGIRLGGTTKTTWDTIPTGANPTGTIALTAVNGSAATFLRSDGAPALGVTISPTWTGNHTFTPASGNTLFSAGNVGIGSATPTQKLDVNGIIYGHTNIGIGTSSPRQALDVMGMGLFSSNVGIGTSVPATSLDVAGTGNFLNVSTVFTVGTEKFGTTWTKGTGWTGTNPFSKGGTGLGTLSQTVANMASPMVNGEIYRVSWNVTALGGGHYFSPSIGGKLLPTFSTTGVKTYDFLCTDNTQPFTITPPYTSYTCTVTDFTLKRLTNGDATFAGYVRAANAKAFVEVYFYGQEYENEGGFTKIDFHNWGGVVTDPGNNWDAVNDWYSVPVSGIYKITTKLRPDDDRSWGEWEQLLSYYDENYGDTYYAYVPVSFGQGAGLTEDDASWFMWFQTNDYRSDSLNIRTSHFNQGDHVFMYCYLDMPGFIVWNAYMTIELLYAD